MARSRRNFRRYLRFASAFQAQAPICFEPVQVAKKSCNWQRTLAKSDGVRTIRSRHRLLGGTDMGQAGNSRRRASRRTRAGLLASVAVFAVGITTLILMTSSAASGASVSPDLVPGNPTCADIGLTDYAGSTTVSAV